MTNEAEVKQWMQDEPRRNKLYQTRKNVLPQFFISEFLFD